MPTSNNNETENVNEELSKALSETTSLAQTLLNEISGNAVALTTLKVQLDSLSESVKALSRIIRDGNGKSLVTRLAIAEKDLKDIEDEVRRHIEHDEKFEKEIHARVSGVKNNLLGEQKTDKEFKREKTISTLKLAASIVPGLLALGLVIVKFFLGAE